MLNGETIQFMRFQKGWGQVELAKRAGISQTLISLMENGSQEISHESKRRILEAFGLDEMDVLKIWNYVNSMKQLNL
ncbi:helix-turn-helix transcriptional regulator [Lentibacillus cibarius]|uniref:Helix-turn-helix transcriptional regulator n=1 Tax=Lentibacillus cibarius TaxID=2583219 RepID=A0A549YES3_9BACI|nr:helix-turn-helix transcriptional regulator [Lentibacillus cibarius]TRM10347.1 helix-turn-helix transcriptional regulator [Lentibacillus cibarius]